MKYSQARTYLLGRPEAVEDFPFGPDVETNNNAWRWSWPMAKSISIGKYPLP